MNAPMVTRRGAIESAKLHVRLDRTIHNGVHEDYEITNYSGEMIEFNLDLRFDGDFADIFDVKEHNLVQRGSIQTRWDGEERTLTTRYRHDDFECGLRLRIQRQTSDPEYANGSLSFPLILEPKQSWHTCLLWLPLGGPGEDGGAIEACHALRTGDPALARRRREWRSRATRITTSDSGVNGVVERAIDDIGSLRMRRMDNDDAHGGDEIDDLVPVRLASHGSYRCSDATRS